MSDVALDRYWHALGLPPNSSLEQVETQYCLLLQRVPEQPTEAEEREWQEMRRAYAILRRASAARGTKVGARVSAALAARAGLVLGAGVILGGLFLLAFNFKSVSVRWTELAVGTELRVEDSNKLYGTVLEFDRNHAFDAGNPGPAYRLRLAETGEEVWVGERLVELGLRRSEPGRVAGRRPPWLLPISPDSPGRRSGLTGSAPRSRCSAS